MPKSGPWLFRVVGSCADQKKLSSLSKLRTLGSILDLDHLGMAGKPRADHLVSWVGDVSTGVARDDRLHARNPLEDGFHAPEASATERGFFDFRLGFWLSIPPPPSPFSRRPRVCHRFELWLTRCWFSPDSSTEEPPRAPTKDDRDPNRCHQEAMNHHNSPHNGFQQSKARVHPSPAWPESRRRSSELPFSYTPEQPSKSTGIDTVSRIDIAPDHDARRPALWARFRDYLL